MVKPDLMEPVGGRVEDVTSGGTACVPWPGRRGGVEYEWYVEITAAGEAVTGPAWRFGSSGACGSDPDCVDRDGCTIDRCVDGFCDATGRFDGDRDGVCEDQDNCPGRYNPVQAASDGDGRGDLCDSCPLDYDPDQYDSDGDRSGEACDCQPVDSRDRSPGILAGVQAAKTAPHVLALTWAPAPGADAYSVSRGDLADLQVDRFGNCLQEGVFRTALQDPEIPPVGSGWFYMVQGQNFDCELGPPGYGSDETMRRNRNPGACIGWPAYDELANDDRTVDGAVTGSRSDTYASDDAYQSIVEIITGGSPETRHSRLEQHWSMDLPGGTRIELHVEAHRKHSKDGDDFVFEYSTDGGSNWIPVDLPTLPTTDQDVDLVAELPGAVAGPFLLRLVDTDHTPGNIAQEWVAVDELFVRCIP